MTILPSGSIGNDIVDLNAFEALGKHLNSRFLAKICSNEEINLISSSNNPHVLLWTLWAIKEASYKALMKHSKIQGFIPNRFICSKDLLSENWFCRYLDHLCSVKVVTAQGYVHAIAFAGSNVEWGNVSSDVLESHIEQEHSIDVRKLAERLLFEAGCKKASVMRSEGAELKPPIVCVDGAPIPTFDVSLSHDGRFVAAALLNRLR